MGKRYNRNNIPSAMPEPLYNYKLIISIKEGIFSKTVDTPRYFHTLEEVRAYFQKRKQEIEQNNQKIWFCKVGEFGKEDYVDTGMIFEDENMGKTKDILK